MKQRQKKYTVTCDNSDWMNSLESSYVHVTSPTGKRISIRKIYMSRFTKEERELVFRCVGNGMVRNTCNKVEVTIPEMETLLRLSKEGPRPRKK